MLQTQSIYIAKTGEALASTTSENQDHLRKMFIGGLSAITTEESLRQFFGQWGEVVDAIVMRDPATKRSRGFGFISYSDISMVDKAQSSRPHIIDGKAVDSKRALPRPEGGKNDAATSVKKIFVGGLKENHDEQSLTEHFSQFGNVVSVKILTDKTTGRKRGFAFVEFDDYDAVDKAVLHKNHTIKYVLVEVKKSIYKQELAKKIASQHHNGMIMTGAPGVPVPSVAQQGLPGHYQQQMAAYNPQAAAYAYPQSVTPGPATAAGPYNGWGGYMPNYQQPIAASYGSYGNTQQNGAAAWNAAAYSPATASWQNGYAPAAASSSLTTISPAPATAPNSWNNGVGTATGVQQTFGDYQQSYNGGPQKAGTLQANRMNPYQVASAANYATTAGYFHLYTSFNNLSIPTTVTVTMPTQKSLKSLPIAAKTSVLPQSKPLRRAY